jgi:NADH dehydrogenase (ubiquinone) flavoprotein 2
MSLALATSALRRSLAPLALRGSRLALPKFAPVAALGARHAGTFKHHNTSDNSTESKFEFDEESEKEIAFTLSKYPDTLQGKQSAIMPMLWIVQQQLDKAHPTMKFKHADPNATKFPKSQGGGGWVPISGMHAIADRLGCSHMEVYEVATFFTMYNRDKLGKFHIQLCATTPCMVCGAYDIMHTIEAHLGIKAGETSSDGLWTLTEVECLGACVNAPMIQVNDMFFEDLTPENTIALLDKLKDGKEVVVGPQNGRINSLGPMGRTSLSGEPAGPYCRELPAPYSPPA